MPTKLYLTANTAEITPTVKGGWANSAATNVYALGESPLGSPTTISSTSTGTEKIIARLVSPPIASNVTISGDAVGVVAVRDTEGNGVFMSHVYVTQGNSTTLVRGTLSSLDYDDVSTPTTTTMTGRTYDLPTFTNVNAQAGDRIVIEIGLDTNSGATASISVGGTSSDIANGGTNMNNPSWVTFDSTITFLYGSSFQAFILE